MSSFTGAATAKKTVPEPSAEAVFYTRIRHTFLTEYLDVIFHPLHELKKKREGKGNLKEKVREFITLIKDYPG